MAPTASIRQLRKRRRTRPVSRGIRIIIPCDNSPPKAPGLGLFYRSMIEGFDHRGGCRMTSEGVVRQALVIGVARFGPDSPDDEEMDATARNPLPYAADLATKLADALGRLGYAGMVLTAPEDTTADQIGWRVRGTPGDPLDPSVVRVVWVLSHGELPLRTDGLMIIGSDDRPGDTNVSTWLADVEDLPDRHPTTLFLLDVCHAGAAARMLGVDRFPPVRGRPASASSARGTSANSANSSTLITSRALRVASRSAVE